MAAELARTKIRIDSCASPSALSRIKIRSVAQLTVTVGQQVHAKAVACRIYRLSIYICEYETQSLDNKDAVLEGRLVSFMTILPNLDITGILAAELLVCNSCVLLALPDCIRAKRTYQNLSVSIEMRSRST